MENLVLKSRLDGLEKSLKQVSSIVPSVQERRQDIHKLMDLLGKRGDIEMPVLAFKGNVGSAKFSLTALQRLVEDPQDQDLVDSALRAITQAETDIETVLQALDKAKGTIELMVTRYIELIEGEELAKTLKDELQEKADDSITILNGIRSQLGEAEEAQDQDEADELLRKAWEEYNDKVYPGSQPLFAEYVDLLAGLALRDTGLDAGICSVADELVRQWVDKLNIAWDSITIPAYQEPLTMTPARIIRVGFPEWTIWALPLTAHEFGHVVVRQHIDSQNETPVKELIDTGEPGEKLRRHRQQYAADAIATYAMGPAYACAAILLRFDPLLAHIDRDDQPAHAKRALVVLTMLEWMSAKNALAPYARITDQLRTEWEVAVDQVNQPDANGVQNLDADELTAWLGGFWEFLDQRRGPIYSTDDWLNVASWPAKLRQDMGQSIEVKGSEELRDVLNAAWQCRVDHPHDAEKIEKAAWGVWQRVDEKRREAATRRTKGYKR